MDLNLIAISSEHLFYYCPFLREWSDKSLSQILSGPYACSKDGKDIRSGKSSFIQITEYLRVKPIVVSESRDVASIPFLIHHALQIISPALSYLTISGIIPFTITISGASGLDEWRNYIVDIFIPNTIDTILDNTFKHFGNIKSVVIPNSVTTIGNYAFYRCISLPSITIPSSVKHIGNYAFASCSSLKSIVIPNGVKSIGIFAFSGCKSLTSITIPNNVTNIGEQAFYNCYSLTSIIIPDGLKNIGKSAFSSCPRITLITIGNSVTYIGDYAFCDCSSLTTMVCKATEAPELGNNVFLNIRLSEATLYVPAQSLDDYKAADQWNDFGTILPLDKAPSAVENTRLPIANSIKLLRNGQVYILQDGKTYTTTGQKL